MAVDELLRRTRKASLPPLAVGLGIYLPATTTLPVVAGAIAGWMYNRWATASAQSERAKQFGVLVASGLIVGESLFGVLLAGLIVSTNKPEPLALVGDGFATASLILGGLAFALVLGGLYWWTSRISQRPA